MVAAGHEWWTDQRVEATVTKHFVYAHLQPEQSEQLTNPVFADLSDKTYLQWILLKARRLFLILIHIGTPGDILRLIEDSYDDDDLPIDADNVSSLGLSQSRSQQIDNQFYRSQFKYLVRIVSEGEHIRYAPDELVPLERADQKVSTSQSLLERVKLPSPANQVFLLKRIRLSETRNELDVLSEIASTKSLSHEHILSVFGSYMQDGCMHVLILPAARYTLGSFLADRPKAFEMLPKPDRRSQLITWPLCLANALAWLHFQGAHHAAIRPSRILIDEIYQISLGYFGGDWVLGSKTSEDNLESYSYAAPELWKRGLTVQTQDHTTTSLLSGGRSAFGRRNVSRELTETRGSNDRNRDVTARQFSVPGENRYTFVPTFKGGSSRLKLEVNAGYSDSISDSLKRVESTGNSRSITPFDSIRQTSSLIRRYDTLTAPSSHSSDGNRRSGSFRTERLYSVAPDTKNAAVQTWKSTAADLPATDVFGLAAVTMDILTVLCSRTVGAFAKHRGARNRQAGRGGGLADSSFHANLPQVGSWAEQVHKDAEKKLKRNRGDVFQAVGPILQVVMQCLDREPQRRLKASVLSRRLQRHLSEFANIQRPHCQLPDQIDAPIAPRPVVSNASLVERRRPIETPKERSTPTSLRYPASEQDERETTKARLITRSDVGSLETSTETSGGRMSNGTSATYCHSVVNTGAHITKEVQDLYDLCDELDLEDTQFVRVEPKRKDRRRFVADFTESDHHDRTDSATSSYDSKGAWQHNDEIPARATTPTAGKSDSYTFSNYPAASPPPSRRLPASPLKSTRRRQYYAGAESPAPLAPIYHANDLLASAARGSYINIDPAPTVSWSRPVVQDMKRHRNNAEL